MNVWQTLETILRRNNATEKPMTIGANEFWIDDNRVCFLKPELPCMDIAVLVAKEVDREVSA